MAFNRDRNDRNSGGERGGFRSRPSFSSTGRPAFGGGDRSSFSNRPRFGDRGPVEMHQAVCDNCGKECQVPFKPTSGKLVYCSECFDKQRGGDRGFDSRRTEGRNFQKSEDHQMFEAVCADCGDKCMVPFRPSSDKPVFCSNCFGDKKNAGGSTGGGKDRFEELNAKLDRILSLLSPTKEIITEEIVEKPVKVAKKKSKTKEETPVLE
jgi:CxxC-x17-CxxC domain-containing protein